MLVGNKPILVHENATEVCCSKVIRVVVFLNNFAASQKKIDNRMMAAEFSAAVSRM